VIQKRHFAVFTNKTDFRSINVKQIVSQSFFVLKISAVDCREIRLSSLIVHMHAYIGPKRNNQISPKKLATPESADFDVTLIVFATDIRYNEKEYNITNRSFPTT